MYICLAFLAGSLFKLSLNEPQNKESKHIVVGCNRLQNTRARKSTA